MAAACEFYICSACGTKFVIIVVVVFAVVSICAFQFLWPTAAVELNRTPCCLSWDLPTVGTVNIFIAGHILMYTRTTYRFSCSVQSCDNWNIFYALLSFICRAAVRGSSSQHLSKNKQSKCRAGLSWAQLSSVRFDGHFRMSVTGQVKCVGLISLAVATTAATGSIGLLSKSK